MMRRRKRVGYIDSPTFGIAVTQSTASMTGAGNSTIASVGLLPNIADAPPDVAWANGWQRQGANAVPDIVIDSISGQLHWGISQPSAGAAPTGVAAISVRAMIYSFGAVPVAGTSTVSIPNVSGIAPTAYLPDISGSASMWSNLARPQAGQRLWWSKTWFSVRNWASTIDGTTWDSSMCDPPSTWLSMKPRKRLKPTDELWLSVQYSVVNLNSFTGTTQITIAPSLKIAAHRVRPRKF